MKNDLSFNMLILVQFCIVKVTGEPRENRPWIGDYYPTINQLYMFKISAIKKYNSLCLKQNNYNCHNNYPFLAF